MEIVRQAKYEDIDTVKNLIKEFYNESLYEYELSLDENTIKETIKNFIDNHIGLVAEINNKIIGVMGGIVATSIFDKKQRLGQEAIWYITKEERKGKVAFKLIEEFEKKCKERGANLISMICMNNLNSEVLDRLYKIKKYKLMEKHYIKEV